MTLTISSPFFQGVWEGRGKERLKGRRKLHEGKCSKEQPRCRDLAVLFGKERLEELELGELEEEAEQGAGAGEGTKEMENTEDAGAGTEQQLVEASPISTSSSPGAISVDPPLYFCLSITAPTFSFPASSSYPTTSPPLLLPLLLPPHVPGLPHPYASHLGDVSLPGQGELNTLQCTVY